MKKFNDFYESYHYLRSHKMCYDWNGRNYFDKCLEIEVVKVNPKTLEIDDNEELNTKTQVWLEFGGYDDDILHSVYHDVELDTGADTFEEAIINLANLVWNKYKEWEC